MLLFVLWPLGRASRIPPAVMMRAHLTDEDERPALSFAAGAAIAGGALFALAILASDERLITSAISAGIVAAFVVFIGFGWVLQKLAARRRRARPPSLALALASIAGPGSLARDVAVSFGLGLGLLVAVAVIDRALMVELSGNLHAEAPSYYFLDVDAKDLDAFRATALAIEPAAKLADAPMLRGRIVAVKGVPAEKVDASPEQRWVLAGDRGLTYTDTVPEGSKLTGRRMVAEGLYGRAARLLRRRGGQGARAQSWATPSPSTSSAAMWRRAWRACGRSTGSRSPSTSSWCSPPTPWPTPPIAC